MTATIPTHCVELMTPRQAAERHNARGLELFGRHRHAAAVAEYDAAVAQWPGCADAFNNRGAARMAAGDRPGAFADYDRAIALNPSLAEAFNNRGTARFLAGDLTAALADLQTAIRLNPAYAAAYDNLAAVHNRNWDHGEAVAAYTRAIALYGPDVRHSARVCDLLALRSFSLYHLRRRGDALADLRRACRQDPGRCARTVMQSLERDSRERYAFTVANCAEYLRDDPADYFTLFRRCVAHLVNGRTEKFRADYDAASRCPVSDDDRAMGHFFLKTLQRLPAAATPNTPGGRDARAQRP